MKIINSKKGIFIGSVIAAGIIIAMVFYLAPQWTEIKQTINTISTVDFLLLTLSTIPMICFRTEAWRVAIHSTESLTPRKPLYLSSILGFTVANFNGIAGIGVQVAALRRLAPRSAPTAGQLATLAVPVIWIEAMLCVVLLAISATVFNLPPYWIPVIIIVVGLSLFAMRKLEKKSEKIAALKGLAVINKPKELALTTALLAGYFITEIFRLWLALKIVGLHPPLFMVVAAFVSIGVIGALPIGAAATPTALVAIFSGQDVVLAASAGLAYSVTVIAATCCLALFVLPILIFKSPLAIDEVLQEGFEFPLEITNQK